MISDSKIVAFVATKDAAGAKTFYETVLGLKLVSDDSFALVFDANGTMLRVQKVQELNPAPYTALGWDVTDISSEVEELVKRGVVFNRYEWLPQDERGVWTAPGGARIAWFKDPDGNTLSLTQFH
jgi:catechol 2,3-dioxygenase-like lactoylglutathione lyase family enzyme